MLTYTCKRTKLINCSSTDSSIPNTMSITATTMAAWAMATATWAVAMVGMHLAAAAHLAMEDIGPMDYTEKLLEPLSL